MISFLYWIGHLILLTAELWQYRFHITVNICCVKNAINVYFQRRRIVHHTGLAALLNHFRRFPYSRLIDRPRLGRFHCRRAQLNHPPGWVNCPFLSFFSLAAKNVGTQDSPPLAVTLAFRNKRLVKQIGGAVCNRSILATTCASPRRCVNLTEYLDLCLSIFLISIGLLAFTACR